MRIEGPPIRRAGASRSILSVLALVAAAGCYRPYQPDCEIACGPGGLCPRGMSCSNGMCTSAARCTVRPPDATPPDAALGDAAVDKGVDHPLDTAPEIGVPAVDAPPDLTGATDAALSIDAPSVADDVPTDLPADAPRDGGVDATSDVGVLLVAAPAGVMQDRADPDTLEIYGVDPGNQLIRRGGQGSKGIEATDLGAPAGVTLVGTPAPLSWEKGRLDIFVLGSDKELYQRWYKSGVWQSWVQIGPVTMSSDPSICSWGIERLDLFARGEQYGDLQHLWYENGWAVRGWESMGGQLGSAPSAVSVDVGRIDVFARDLNDKLIHLAYVQMMWLPWESLGDQLAFGPAVASRKAGIIEVFAAQADRQLRSFEWTPSSRGAWKSLGVQVPGDFRVVSVAPRRVLVLSRQAGQLWQRSVDYNN